MSSTIFDFLKKHPSMNDINAVDIARLCSQANVKDFDANATIFSKETPAAFIYFILDGKVILEGNNKSVIKKSKHHYIGEESMFEVDTYQSSAIASEKVKVLEISKETFNTLVKKYPNLYTYFFNSFHEIAAPKSNVKELDQQKTEKNDRLSFKILMSWILAFLVPLIVYSLIGNTLTHEGQLFIAVLSAAVILWIFNIFPDFVPALLILTSTLIMGLVPLKVILSGFSSNIFFLILGITSLSILVSSSGILYRIMLLIMKYLPSGFAWYNFAIFFIGTLMTPVIPSIINRTKTAAPLTQDLIGLLSLEKKGGASTKISASAFYGVSLLSSIFLTGSIMNFVIIGILPFQDQRLITSIGWLNSAGVAGLILLIIHFVGSSIFFVSKDKITISKEKIDDQLKIIGELTTNEIATIGTLILFIISLICIPYHKIPVEWLSLFLLFSLLSLKIVSQKQWLMDTDWSLLVFLGCIIGISSSIHYLNIDAFISSALAPLIKPLFHNDNISGILSLVIVLTIAVRFFLPVGPTVIIMMTLCMPLADTFGLSLWSFSFTIIMSCDIWFFPYQSPFYISYTSSFPGDLPYNQQKFLIYNMLINFGRIVAIYLSIPYWKTLGII